MTRLQIQFVHSSWHFLTACSMILPASVYFLWSVAMRVRSVRTGQYKCDVHFGQGAGVDRIVGRSAAPDARMFFVTRIRMYHGHVHMRKIFIMKQTRVMLSSEP